MLYDAFGAEIIHKTGAEKDDIHDVRLLQFYKGPLLVKTIKVLRGIDGWARDIVLKYWNDQPREWDQAVIQCANYARMATKRLFNAPLWASKELILSSLTNSNTYVAPNYDMDTAFNINDCYVLKSNVMPALTDLIYAYNNITMTGEQSFSILLIELGNKKTGAASNGQKSAILSLAAGITVTFGGNATNTNSGIKMSPTTPGTNAECRACALLAPGTSGSHITLTVDGEAWSTSKRWTIQNVYGRINMTYVDFKWNYGPMFSAIQADTTKCNVAPIINNCTSGGNIYVTGTWITFGTINCDMAANFNFNTFGIHDANFATTTCISMPSVTFLSGGSVSFAGTKIQGSTILNPTPLYVNILQTKPSVTSGYLGDSVYGFADIRPTQVVPTSLTFYDPGTDGELWFTIANYASYATTDIIRIYDNSTNLEKGASTISRYTARAFGAGAFANGYGIIPGLANDALFTGYAKATSNGLTLSAATATTTGTPTLAATDAAFVALENLRNKLNTGTTIADIRLTKSVKIANVDYNGTLNAAGLVKPDAPTGFTAVPLSQNSIQLTWNMMPRAESYTIKRALISGGPYTNITEAMAISAVSFIDTNVVPSTDYFYKIFATNTTDVSDDSTEVTATITLAIAHVTEGASTTNDCPPDGTLFDFYTVASSANGEYAEALLKEDVPGKLQVNFGRKVDGQEVSDAYVDYTFFPANWITGVTRGNRVVDALGNVYSVIFVENFRSHQEISLRKKTK